MRLAASNIPAILKHQIVHVLECAKPPQSVSQDSHGCRGHVTWQVGGVLSKGHQASRAISENFSPRNP
jgi:hypothetical protein